MANYEELEEIERRAIRAFCGRPEGAMNQPSEGSATFTGCGKFIKLRNCRGVLATYKITRQAGGGIRLSFVKPSS